MSEKYIQEYKNKLPVGLCEDIIEKLDSEIINTPFDIPKNNKSWEKIERLIFKQLLIHIHDYKTKLALQTDEIVIDLNNTLFTKHFRIYKNYPNQSTLPYAITPNRYNVLTYIFFLNDIDFGGELVFDTVTIKPKAGKLVLFPYVFEDKYKYISPVSSSQYLICGQLCYDNIV
jgi:hypothetical protein